MGPEGKIIVAAIFTAVSLSVAAYEIVKWMAPEVTLSKLIAVGICGICALIMCISEGLVSLPKLFIISIAPLAFIWFGDELGSITGIKMGLVQRQTPGVILRLCGWILISVLVGYVLFRQTLV